MRVGERDEYNTVSPNRAWARDSVSREMKATLLLRDASLQHEVIGALSVDSGGARIVVLSLQETGNGPGPTRASDLQKASLQACEVK